MMSLLVKRKKNIDLLVIVLLFFISMPISAQISVKRLDKLSGAKLSPTDIKSKWDSRYSRSSFVYGKSPAKFLAENYSYIPADSEVLDMGMGEGRNAIFLAQKGHKVTGIDISSVAIKKAYLLAKEFGVRIKGIVASLEKYSIPNNSFDAIICFYYVDRNLVSKMKKWLKPGGILLFEAYTLAERKKTGLEKEPEKYYLKDQELLSLFPGMRILKYEEPLHGIHHRASIILQKKR